jgi:hypothetical protein
LVHYRLPYLETLGDAWIYVVPTLLLVIGTYVLLWRNRPAGFLLTFVLVVLAPTSIVPIITEMAAERRMYLPLAALAVLIVVGGYVVVERLARQRHAWQGTGARVAVVAPLIALVVIFGIASNRRLQAYGAPLILWRQVVDHQPANALHKM